ncbi:16413_t:CDS:2, partial [Gigaspora margarita]
LSKPAKERNEIDRRNFVLEMSQYMANQLAFSNELAYDRRTLSCHYAYSIQKGSMNTQYYENFIENVLRFSVLVLDNTSIHRGTHLYNLYQEKGIKLEFLPPYSPNYNPWAESIEDPLDVLDLIVRQLAQI